jgi:hypothetical protein
VLHAKGLDAAALGYWIDDQLTVALIASNASKVLQIPHVVAGTFERARIIIPDTRRGLIGVLLDNRAPGGNVFWSRVVGMLQPGDVLRVAPEPDAALQLALVITSHGKRVGSLRLPRGRLPRPSAA